MSSQTSRGVLYVAYGDAAREECAQSINSLAQAMTNVPPMAIICDAPMLAKYTSRRLSIAYRYQPDQHDDLGARRKKLAMNMLSPFDATLYLDADTRVHGSLNPLFAILDHWPMLLTYSSRQGEDVLGNCPPQDRAATFTALGTRDVLGLQCGVLGFRKDDIRVMRLFDAWSEEWERFKDRDQAAFLRALHRAPLPIHIVGRDWNGGSIIEHRYGHAARPRR